MSERPLHASGGTLDVRICAGRPGHGSKPLLFEMGTFPSDCSRRCRSLFRGDLLPPLLLSARKMAILWACWAPATSMRSACTLRAHSRHSRLLCRGCCGRLRVDTAGSGVGGVTAVQPLLCDSTLAAAVTPHESPALAGLCAWGTWGRLWLRCICGARAVHGPGTWDAACIVWPSLPCHHREW